MRANRPHKSLRVWQKAVDLVCTFFRMSAKLPKEQTYVLGAQIQRAAISVPSNIAEGMAKRSPKDRTRFLEISQGSLSELDTLVEIARKLEMIDERTYNDTMDAIDD